MTYSSWPFNEDELETSGDEWTDFDEMNFEVESSEVGCRILQLPTEILHKILGYLAFHEVRLCSRLRCRVIFPLSYFNFLSLNVSPSLT